MVAFYQAANGDDWLKNANWLSDAPFGVWHAVVTDSGGRVVSLVLSENGLRGPIAAEPGGLTELYSSVLADNAIDGPLPPTLGRLTGPFVLDLANNRLSGTTSASLGTASPGDRHFITGKNRSLRWWRINFNHESGWIFSNLVTADGPLNDVPVIKAFDWEGCHDSGRRLWFFYPPGWFLLNMVHPSDADRRSLIEHVGRETAEEWLSDANADIDAEQK